MRAVTLNLPVRILYIYCVGFVLYVCTTRSQFIQCGLQSLVTSSMRQYLSLGVFCPGCQETWSGTTGSTVNQQWWCQTLWWKRATVFSNMINLIPLYVLFVTDDKIGVSPNVCVTCSKDVYDTVNDLGVGEHWRILIFFSFLTKCNQSVCNVPDIVLQSHTHTHTHRNMLWLPLLSHQAILIIDYAE